MQSRCNACREVIVDGARVCRYCGQPCTFRGRLWRGLKGIGGVVVVMSLLVTMASLSVFGLNLLEKREAISELTAAADRLGADGDFKSAWSLYDRAENIEPGLRSIRRGREQLAEAWLLSARFPANTDYAELARRTLPVMMLALVRSEGQTQANYQALIGWAHFIDRRHNPEEATDVTALYRRALEMDPDNAYANAFMGYWQLTRAKDLQAGMAHFQTALARAYAKPLVREYQWFALARLKRDLPVAAPQYLAVCSAQLGMLHQMLAADEPLIAGYRDTMRQEAIACYGEPSKPESDWFEQIWPALEPAEHLQLVTQMTGDLEKHSQLRAPALFLLGRIHEKMGNSTQALLYYRELAASLGRRDPLRVPLRAAFQRLTGSPGGL